MFTRRDRYPYSRKRTKCCNRGSTNVDSFFEVQRSLRNLEVDEAGVKRPLEHQTDLREPENIIVVVGVGSLLDDLEPARDIYIGEGPVDVDIIRARIGKLEALRVLVALDHKPAALRDGRHGLHAELEPILALRHERRLVVDFRVHERLC